MVSTDAMGRGSDEDQQDLVFQRERRRRGIVRVDGAGVWDLDPGAGTESGNALGETIEIPMILLASKSARRRQLLSEGGLSFELLEAAVDDGVLDPGATDPNAWVASLAYLKAAAALNAWRAGASTSSAPAVILGADTVVVKQDEIIGQPEDPEHASAIVRRLRAGSHVVVTGVALLDTGSGARDIFIDATAVTVGEIPNEWVEAYVASGDWRGKAGAYNLQERIDAGWPLSYEGDPTTVMGLPMGLLPDRLVRFWRQCRGMSTPNAAC